MNISIMIWKKFTVYVDTAIKDLFNVLQVTGPEVCRILIDIRQVFQHGNDTVSTLIEKTVTMKE